MSKSEKETVLIVKEKVVKYMGLSDVRVIRKEDWAQIGVEHDDVQWDKTNNWRVPAKDLSKDVLEYCQHDRELMVVDD